MRRLILLFALLGITLFAAPQGAAADERGQREEYRPYAPFAERFRTARRSPTGQLFYPKWLLATPEHYAFLPLTSNHDPRHDHPAQWAGQDWGPAAWHPDWTPETTVKKFVEARIFSAQYLDRGVPVLELGPTFYRLSDLDRRRTLKLVADYTEVFSTYQAVMLRDWYTKDIVGSYSPKGMVLH